MPRVKRGVVRRQKRKKLSKLTKGYFQNKSKLYKFMKEASEKAGVYSYTGPQAEEARLPRLVDHPHQRRRARKRHLLQQVHARHEERRHRARSQEPRRTRRARARGIYQARRESQGSSRVRCHAPCANPDGAWHRDSDRSVHRSRSRAGVVPRRAGRRCVPTQHSRRSVRAGSAATTAGPPPSWRR